MSTPNTCDVSSNTSPPTTTFHIFIKLPSELQDEIWKKGLQHLPRIFIHDSNNATGNLKLHGSATNPLLWTCTASRRMALEKYTAWGPCQVAGGFEGLFPVLPPRQETRTEIRQRFDEEQMEDWDNEHLDCLLHGNNSNLEPGEIRYKDEAEQNKSQQSDVNSILASYNPLLPFRSNHNCLSYTFIDFDHDVFGVDIKPFRFLPGFWRQKHRRSCLDRVRHIASANWKPSMPMSPQYRSLVNVREWQSEMFSMFRTLDTVTLLCPAGSALVLDDVVERPLRLVKLLIHREKIDKRVSRRAALFDLVTCQERYPGWKLPDLQVARLGLDDGSAEIGIW